MSKGSPSCLCHSSVLAKVTGIWMPTGYQALGQTLTLRADGCVELGCCHMGEETPLPLCAQFLDHLMGVWPVLLSSPQRIFIECFQEGDLCQGRGAWFWSRPMECDRERQSLSLKVGIEKGVGSGRSSSFLGSWNRDAWQARAPWGWMLGPEPGLW